VTLVIRTWNVFHGNATPPERRSYLAEMVRLVTADEPDIVCLQELPGWSLPALEAWSGMQAFVSIAQPARLGPLPIPPAAGRAVTSLNNGLFRSAFSGQANAILVTRAAGVVDRSSLVLNAARFRAAQAEWLGLDLVARLAWAKERRVVQAALMELDGSSVVVANLHATGYAPDQRLADAELLRAAVFVDGVARPGDTVVLAGDFNVPASRSATQADLAGGEWGFSKPIGEGIDQVLVRGAALESIDRWPRERRRVAGRLLSDHTPVEARAA
jgi:endonuclease/exonuclease/phosphatase family metal-dependent hydrolase